MQNAFIAELLARPALVPVVAVPVADENPKMHDSAIFDVIVKVDFYDGTRLRIPQQSTPEGWECPF